LSAPTVSTSQSRPICAARTSNAINLMDALKRSLEADKVKAPAPSKRRAVGKVAPAKRRRKR
jgi:non-homologous end joining protein Ku